MDDHVFQPDLSQVFHEPLVGFLLLGHGSLGSLLHSQNSSAGCALRVDLSCCAVACTCQVSCHLDKVILEHLHIRRHLSRRDRAYDLTHIVHSAATGLDHSADIVQSVRVGHSFSVHNLLRVGLRLYGQDAAHLRLVDFDLIGNEVAHLAFTTGRAFLLFPDEVCNGVHLQLDVLVFHDVAQPCGCSKVYRTFFFPQLVYDGYLAIQLNLCGIAGIVKAVLIGDDVLFLLDRQAHFLCPLEGSGKRQALAYQDVGLSLDIVFVFVSVEHIILVEDLVDRHHHLLVEIYIDDTFRVDGGVVGHSAPLVIQRVMLPHMVGIPVKHPADLLGLELEFGIFIVLRGIDHRIQIVMDDRHLVLDDRLDEILLDRFHIAQNRTLPLISVVESVIPIRIGDHVG